MYGYRENESGKIPTYDPKTNTFNNQGSIVDVDPNVRIVRKLARTDQLARQPAAISLGPHLQGAALPRPDRDHFETAATGFMYRVGRVVPNADKPSRKFRRFVKSWLNKNMTPLDFSTDLSVETWLENTPYTQKRKDQLLKLWREKGCDLKNFDPGFFKLKSFIKDEDYPTYKHARTINSRSDLFKCAVGPAFQAVSNELFKRPEFIKKVPIHERPRVILDAMGHATKVFDTDFTSFEAHFYAEPMMDCEMWLMAYMLSKHPLGRQILELIMLGKIVFPNVLVFKHFIAMLCQRRMSGEMDTSLSNGFSNLMKMLYALKEHNIKVIICFIEGDDGLFAIWGVPPTPAWFKANGSNVKMNIHNSPTEASFCGMIFDPIELTNVTDPISELVSFGWANSKYLKYRPRQALILLRCKALSLAYQYPACPILSVLAHKICLDTRSIDVENWLKKHGLSGGR